MIKSICFTHLMWSVISDSFSALTYFIIRSTPLIRIHHNLAVLHFADQGIQVVVTLTWDKPPLEARILAGAFPQPPSCML